MLLRKRAWDLAKEDYGTVRATDTVADAMRVINQMIAKQPDSSAVVVLDSRGELNGAITLRDLMRFMERVLCTEEVAQQLDEGDVESAFRHTCGVAATTSLAEVVESAPLVIKPNEPLLLVLEDFVSTGREVAVVMESGKILGVIQLWDLYKEMSRDVLAGL